MGASLVAQMVKFLPAMWETRVLSLGQEDPLEKEMAPHSSTLAWKIPWMEEPGSLQSTGSLRVGHNWVTSLSLFTFMHWRRKRQTTPVFLPRESQGQRSLVGCCLWGRTESDMTEQLNWTEQMPYPHWIEGFFLYFYGTFMQIAFIIIHQLKFSKKKWYIYTMEHYSAIKMNKIGASAKP